MVKDFFLIKQNNTLLMDLKKSKSTISAYP
jgi:hypothetical protein